MTSRLSIARRFRGPAGSGNGGYVCGRLAAALTGTARVRLLAPPPLDTELTVEPLATGVELRAGDTVVARAWPAPFALSPPASPDVDAARASARAYRGFCEHAFPGCFVCGPERRPGDGLRIFPGPGAAGVQCTWIPDESLANAAGEVLPWFVWAALDCPGGWAFMHAGPRPAVEPQATHGRAALRCRASCPAGKPPCAARLA